MASLLNPTMTPGKKHQGPAMGGPEEPGALNSSPSTAAADGFWQAAQQMAPPAAGWNEIAAPDGMDPSLGTRTPSMGAPMKVLAKLVRGVY